MKRIVRGLSEKMRVFCPRCRVHHLLLSRLALQATQPLHKAVASPIRYLTTHEFKAQSLSARAVTNVTGFPTCGLSTRVAALYPTWSCKGRFSSRRIHSLGCM